MFYDHMRANLDCEFKDTCPTRKDLGYVLVIVKQRNNAESWSSKG